jgi:ABC-2 type transport system permease protein
MQRMLTMIKKEFKQIFRDKPMMAIIFVVPLVQLLIMSFAITVDVKHIKLVIADLDNSKLSRDIVNSFGNTDRFDIVGHTRDLNQIKDQFKEWQTQMALIIPTNFARDLQRNLKPQIQLSVDGVDGNSAGVALGYASGILSQFGLNHMIHPKRRQILKDTHIVTMEERMWYNLDLSSKQYMVPGIAVVLLTILPMMLSAMSLVREKEIGTLEQLMVTPLKKHQLLLGKLIPFLILSFIELTILIIVAIFVFNIPMVGSFGLLAFLAFLYLFTTLGLGIFISTMTNSQQQAMFFAWFIMVFMILMSGFFIPIENMPETLRKLTYLNPMRYFLYIVRDIFQKGSSLQYLYKDAIPMAFYGIAIFSFSVLKFQKRVG